MGKIVIGDKKYPTMFKAATWVPAKDLSILTRKTLEDMDFTFKRSKGIKSFSKVVLVVPLPKFSYVFEFNVEEPEAFCIRVYDIFPTASAEVHLLEIEPITKYNLPHVKEFVSSLSGRLPKKPWKFSLSERFRYGFAAPEYITARKKWQLFGAK